MTTYAQLVVMLEDIIARASEELPKPLSDEQRMQLTRRLIKDILGSKPTGDGDE